MLTKNKTTFVVNAAGGNATVITIMEEARTRDWYSQEGGILIDNFKDSHGAEQSGFIILDTSHFEMAGGEFCGNAARAAAMLFAKVRKTDIVNFTMSGFDGIVSGNVSWSDQTHAHVTCKFPDLPTQVTEVTVLNNTPAKLVDLGGIVHVIIEDEFPCNDYENKHREVVQELSLRDRSAVGVCWLSKTSEGTRLDPVVWVRSIDSFFYETACGSGSIAAHAATGDTNIVQPSNLCISAKTEGNVVILSSEMEITHAQ